MYKETASVDDLFDLLAPRWNWKHYGLLEFLVKASRSEDAMKRLQEFLEIRGSAAPNVTLHVTQAAKAISGLVHEASLTQPQAQPFAEATAEQEEEQETTIVAKVDKDTLTLEDYDQKTSVVCRTLDIERHHLCLDSITDGCIAIQWKISVHLVSELQRQRITTEHFQALARKKITEVKIGSVIHMSVATKDYWDRKQPEVRNYSGISVFVHPSTHTQLIVLQLQPPHENQFTLGSAYM